MLCVSVYTRIILYVTNRLFINPENPVCNNGRPNIRWLGKSLAEGKALDLVLSLFLLRAFSSFVCFLLSLLYGMYLSLICIMSRQWPFYALDEA